MALSPLPPSSTGVLRNAPAVEVIYSIRVAVSDAIASERFLEAVKRAFPNDFAEQYEFKAFLGQFVVKHDGTTEQDVKVETAGYRFSSQDKTFLAHHLNQSLNLNYLKPYIGYDEAIARLKRHWEVYKSVVGTAPITGISLRYIDRIDIPKTGPTFNLNEYFNMVAKLPDGLHAHHCYQQYWLNDPESDIRARVIWSSLEDQADHWSFALDTEAILEPANIAEPDQLWTRFDDLHAWCWHVFDQSLTPVCKAHFQ